MKELDRLIITKIMEISFLILVLIGTYPIWKKVNNTIKNDMYLADASYTYLEIDNPINYYMRPMKDEIAYNYLKPCHIEVKNERISNINYTLVLKIDNSSTLKPQNLNIRINNNIMGLENLKNVSDNLYTYYIIDQGNTLEKEPSYDIIFWLKENTKSDEVNEKLIFAFDLMNSNTSI